MARNRGLQCLLLLIPIWLAASIHGFAGSPAPEDLARQLIAQLGSHLADERDEARERLQTLGTAAVPLLILATDAEDPILRWEAVNLLGVLGDPRAMDAVLRVATTDPDVHARWRANWALGRLDDGSCVPRLIAALSGEDPTVSWNAAVSLSLFGAIEAVPVLHEGLSAEGWRQWEAVNALGRVWNEETAARLTAVLVQSTEGVRKEAALSLGRIGGADALAALLTALAGDPSPEVRWRAAMMIRHIGDEEAVGALLEIRAREDHPLVIRYIDEAIESLAGTAWASPFVAGRTDPSMIISVN